MATMTTPRERTEEIERQVLSERAQLASATKGRERDEPQDDLRTVYQRDRDRIVHAKAFRRLKHKTQVFLSPQGDHYRVRLTHTLDVSQIARTAARALRLNEDLAEAIALGHDLGHTPFGHLGEQALTPFLGRPFRHSEQSLRVVDHLENDGEGSEPHVGGARRDREPPVVDAAALHPRGPARAVRGPDRLPEPRRRRRAPGRRPHARRSSRPGRWRSSAPRTRRGSTRS